MAIGKTSSAPKPATQTSTPAKSAPTQATAPKTANLATKTDTFGAGQTAKAPDLAATTRPKTGITRNLDALQNRAPAALAQGAAGAAGVGQLAAGAAGVAQLAAGAGAEAVGGVSGAAPVNGNDALNGIPTTGASDRTARQDRIASGGVDASHQMAQTDQARVMRHRETFEALGAQHNLPPALLAAIASRETRGGNILDRNGYGDHGNGFGLMQVDKRYHDLQGTDSPTSRAHLEQATGILAGFHQQMQTDHPDWTPQQQLQGAVAAYNAGPGRMQDPATFDNVTTGRDYSNDVIARAQYYAANWGN